MLRNLWLLALVCLCCRVIARADDWESHLYRAEHGKSRQAAKTKSTSARGASFRGYGRYDQQFRQLCAFLEFDGRRERFHQIMEANSARDAECVACRPLFRGLAKACRPAPARRTQALAVESAGALSKQREPRVEVVQIVGELFRDIARDQDVSKESVPAVYRLVSRLRAEQDLSPAEKDYFGLVADLVELPFQSQLLKVSADKKKSEVQADWDQKEGSLDAFFDD